MNEYRLFGDTFEALKYFLSTLNTKVFKDFKTDSLASKTTEKSYLNINAGIKNKTLTTDAAAVTGLNEYDTYLLTHANGNITFTLPSDANASGYTRMITLYTDARNNTSDYTLTIAIPDGFTAASELTDTIKQGIICVTLIELIGTTVYVSFATEGDDYVLPAATSSKLGGIKVGSGLSVTTDGTLSATAQVPDLTNLKTDNISSKTTANSYITLDAGTRFKMMTNTSAAVTSTNEYDYYYLTNNGDITFTLNTGANEADYIRIMTLYINCKSNTANTTLTVALPSDLTLLSNADSTTIDLTYGIVNVVILELIGTNVYISSATEIDLSKYVTK